MQEEVTGKAVALIVDGARMSEQVLEKALKAYQKSRGLDPDGSCGGKTWTSLLGTG